MWNQELYTVLEVLCTTLEQSRTKTFLDWLEMTCLMHPRIWLAFLTARAHSWRIFNLLSTRTHRSPASHPSDSRIAPSQVQSMAALPLFKTYRCWFPSSLIWSNLISMISLKGLSTLEGVISYTYFSIIHTLI